MPLICSICGDVARGMNFDVITCMSCKAFFRRHASQATKNAYCLLDNNCHTTKESRSSCSACRLKKCYLLGMNPNLIRSPYKRQIKQRKYICLPQPKPISLISDDRSTLTLDEWNLLSNIVNAYDEQNLVVRTQCCLKEQSSLPPKIRSKHINTLELVGSFYTAIQPLIERCPYFHSLPTDIRKIIIQNNLNGTGGFNSMFSAADANVFDNDAYVVACNEIYGEEYVKVSRRLITKIESNRTLLKIMLMVLAFSSNCSIVSYDYSTSSVDVSLILHITRIQDIFVTMLWKYLVYQYGFAEAVRRFTYLIKNYLDVLNRIHANNSAQHWKMVDIIVEKTTNLLTSDD